MSKPGATGGGGLVAVIPARGGSKRLPRKNLLPLGGKPLIRWSLEAARDSGVVDHLLVTSDDREILAEAEAFGAFPLLRPAELATDTATTTDTLLHALDALEEHAIKPGRIMLLQPTSPLRTAEDICDAVRLFELKHADSVISVCVAEHSPLWFNTISPDGRMDNFLSQDVLNVRSQDLPTYYRLNGAVYLSGVDVFRRNNGFFMKNSHALIMPSERSVDIDTYFDYRLAECLLRNMMRK